MQVLWARWPKAPDPRLPLDLVAEALFTFFRSQLSEWVSVDLIDAPFTFAFRAEQAADHLGVTWYTPRTIYASYGAGLTRVQEVAARVKREPDAFDRIVTAVEQEHLLDFLFTLPSDVLRYMSHLVSLAWPSAWTRIY